MPDPLPVLPAALTAELDQRMAENATTARLLAAYHQALKDQGLSDALAASLTEMHAGYAYERALHADGCRHDEL